MKVLFILALCFIGISPKIVLNNVLQRLLPIANELFNRAEQGVLKWSRWGPCSKTCGPGQQKQVVRCLPRGSKCVATPELKEGMQRLRSCHRNRTDCRRTTPKEKTTSAIASNTDQKSMKVLNGELKCGQWSVCHDTCGDERRNRTCTCEPPGAVCPYCPGGVCTVDIPCDLPACGIIQWSSWSKCHGSGAYDYCGNKSRYRSGKCSPWGLSCESKPYNHIFIESKPCNLPPCPESLQPEAPSTEHLYPYTGPDPVSIPKITTRPRFPVTTRPGHPVTTRPGFDQTTPGADQQTTDYQTDPNFYDNNPCTKCPQARGGYHPPVYPNFGGPGPGPGIGPGPGPMYPPVPYYG